MSGGWKSGGRDPRYNTPAWKRARAAALRRANHRCELRLDGCQGRATEVDHVLGLDNDPGHTTLRAVCSPCHRKVTAQQGVAARRNKPRDPPFTPRTKWLSHCVTVRSQMSSRATLPAVPGQSFPLPMSLTGVLGHAE